MVSILLLSATYRNSVTYLRGKFVIVYILGPLHGIHYGSVSQTYLFAAPFALRKITTDPHIPVQVNIE